MGRIIFWIGCAVVYLGSLQAQTIPDFFSGQIVTEDSVAGVPYAHVINRTKHLGTVANSSGFFSITADSGDEIVISAIGYREESFLITPEWISLSRRIVLTEQIYPLDEVKVFRFNDYKSFKREFMRNLPPEDTTFLTILPPLEGYARNRPDWGAGVSLGSPITSLYNLLSREGRSTQKLMAILNGTDENLIISQKFNGFIIRSLTGLQGDALLRFISYCDFHKDFLLLASQQEIRRAVLVRYEQFRKGI